MRRAQDLTGRRFERLLVVGPSETKPRYWNCVCDCGATRHVGTYNLLNGDCKSCGCYSRDRSRLHPGNTKHSMSNTPTYRTWSKMKERCFNPRFVKFSFYGGRGITVCERWMTFANFLADMGVRPTGMTLDRKDSDGDYEPSNCRWATRLEQANNTRTNRFVDLDGERLTVAQLARRTGINDRTIIDRLNRGLPYTGR